jgi:glycosyltransferase involved in cell wall biosynthesis
MVYDSLKTGACGRYDIDMYECDTTHSVPEGYDIYLVNWHPITTSQFLSEKTLQRLGGKKISIILETSPGNPFVCTPQHWFDAHMVLDPTCPRMANTYSFPRPIEVMQNPRPLLRDDIPVIGSFGLACPRKNYPQIVQIANQEFERAIVRFNFAPFFFADPRSGSGKHIIAECRAQAKPHVEVIGTTKNMDKQELISWLSEHTLNVFLYRRNMAGLSATTDQAISCGRPLLVTDCDTFRHLKDIPHHPATTFAQAISKGNEAVQRLQEEWSPVRFADRFVHVLSDLGVY